MKLIYIMFLIFIHLNLYAEDIITLKSSQQINAKMEKVNNWGLVLESKISINFKVIESIKTNNYLLANEILNLISDVQSLILADSIYYLDFSKVIIKENTSSKERTISAATITFLYSSTQSEQYELQLKYLPSITKILFVQMSFSGGSWKGKKEFPDYTRYTLVYETKAYNFGIGSQFSISDHYFYISLNYSSKTILAEGKSEINNNFSEVIRTDNFYSSLGFIFTVFEKYHLTIGSRYFTSGIDIFPDYRRISFNCGIGLDLFAN